MWFVFLILFTGAFISLELMEGYKIRTTEYYGLLNLGFTLVAVVFLAAAIIYMIIMFPLAWLLGFVPWNRRWFIVYILLYAALWAAAGIWLFHELYQPDFVLHYNLHVSSAVWMFGVMGLLYGWIEWIMLERVVRRT